MANTKVEIKAVVKCDVQELYVVGSTQSLGAWDAKKAVKMDYCEACGCFVVNKMLPAGEAVEFKFLASKNWANVEKGNFGEELANHSLVAAKGLSVTVEVNNFAK